jgi:hypothetical protein
VKPSGEGQFLKSGGICESMMKRKG